MKSKRWISLILLLAAVLVVCLCGCTEQENVPTEPTDGTRTLRVLSSSELSVYGPVEENFLANHEDVKIEFQRIPMDAEEREVFLEQLRVEIMAGKGPDVYIMTQDDTVFRDVAQSIRNGLFMDIGEYYDGDTGLDHSGFNASIMEAGVYEGGRYVLPLRYDTPVLCLTEEAVSESGLDMGGLASGLSGIVEMANAIGADAVGMEPAFMYYYWMDLLPRMIDYDTQELVVSQADLAAFLEEYRALVSQFDGHSIPWVSPIYQNYVNDGAFWATDGIGVHVTGMYSVLANVRLASATGTELMVLPLRASDGALTASVIHWAAVGSGCKDPELAYEFVREFLTEESQWIELSSAGFPVLTEGAWDAVDLKALEGLEIGSGVAEGAKKRKADLREAAVDAEDYRILYGEFDRVRLPHANTAEYMFAIEDWLNSAMDAEAFAQELLHEIQLHAAEG